MFGEAIEGIGWGLCCLVREAPVISRKFAQIQA
jgi:hypothetical protein